MTSSVPTFRVLIVGTNSCSTQVLQMILKLNFEQEKQRIDYMIPLRASTAPIGSSISAPKLSLGLIRIRGTSNL